DQDPDETQAEGGSFAISSLIRLSTSASSCPKSSRYECSAAWRSRSSSSENSIVCMSRPPWLVASTACPHRDHRHALRPRDGDASRLRIEAQHAAAPNRNL